MVNPSHTVGWLSRKAVLLGRGVLHQKGSVPTEWRERGCWLGKKDDRYACNACWDCITSPSCLPFSPLLSFPGPRTMFWLLPAHMIKLVLLVRLEHILPLVCSLASPAHPLLYLQSLAKVELAVQLSPALLHRVFALAFLTWPPLCTAYSLSRPSILSSETRGVAQLVEHLPSKHRALGLSLNSE